MFDQGGNGNSVAVGTILVALIETLIEKGVITRADVSGILTRATAALQPTSTITSTQEALRVIASLQKKFPR